MIRGDEALKAVSNELVGLCWDLGGIIAKRQDVEGWGKGDGGTARRQSEGGVSLRGCFWASNLWRMKAFLESETRVEKHAPLARENGLRIHHCRIPLAYGRSRKKRASKFLSTIKFIGYRFLILRILPVRHSGRFWHGKLRSTVAKRVHIP
jgi:hypothetical protein